MKKILFLPILSLLCLPCPAVSPSAGSWFVDAHSGSDSNDGRSMAAPKATITSAKSGAGPGDTIYVLAGTYSENNLLKCGVNYYFYPGAIVTWNVPSATDAGWGIFDDRSSGATTNVIGGHGNFNYSNSTGTTNTLGMFVLTNAASKVEFTCNDVDFGSDNTIGDIDSAFAIINCNYCSINCNRLDDSRGTQAPIGLLWIYGETHFHANFIGFFNQYGIWSFEQALNLGFFPVIAQPQIDNATNSLYLSWDVCQSQVYVLNNSTNLRCWFNFNELNTPAAGGTALQIVGGGKYYINGQKVEAETTCLSLSGCTNTADLQVWCNIEKLSTPGTWLDLEGGTLHADIDQFEDLGITTDGIHIGPETPALGGEFFVRGHRAKLLPGSKAKLVNIANGRGTNRFSNLTFDSTGNTRFAPITVAGAGTSFDNCVFISSAANSIGATGAQRVGIYGACMANLAPTNLITLSPAGGLTVDANVR